MQMLTLPRWFPGGLLPVVCAGPLQLRHSWRRRQPPVAGVDAAEVGGVVVEEEGEGGDSSWSLMVDLPSLDRIVKETVSPATSSSSHKLKIFGTQASRYLNLKNAGAHNGTSFHVHDTTNCISQSTDQCTFLRIIFQCFVLRSVASYLIVAQLGVFLVANKNLKIMPIGG